MKLIPLSKGAFAMVDDEDYERLSRWKWYATSHPYACRKEYIPETQGCRSIYMHVEVAGIAPLGKEIDHRNQNKLDNRKENLRFATRGQNTFNKGLQKNNKTGIKGVFFATRDKKYVAAIKVNGRRISLGYFTDPEDAKSAYNKAALEHARDFAVVN